MTPSGLLVSAGEASGDQRAARVISALRRRHPGLPVYGLGSDELRGAGLEALADSREISVVGISEALSILPRAGEIFRSLLSAAERRRPRAALLVDFPEFNLRLARELAWRGIPVVYYVSPQIWAWRRGRVRTVADTVAKMLVLFPFETTFYRRHGVPVTHVGHPLVDEVPELAGAWEDAVGRAPVERYRIALLPGSRRSEIRALLPTLLAAVKRLGERLPVEPFVVRAPSLEPGEVASVVSASGFDVPVVADDRYTAIASAHLALCASGTATLETGLLRTPMLVVYRLSRWSHVLARLLVRVPHVGLVNLVLGERAVPELIQDDARPERIAREAFELLVDRPRIERTRRLLGELRGRLGPPGASERAADEIERFLLPRAVA